MYKFAEIFGILTAISFVLAIFNYFSKEINKKIIKKINNNFIKDIYKIIMINLIKNHKIFGIIALIFLLIHVIFAVSFVGISLTGIVAFLFLVTTVNFGIYGIRNKTMGKYKTLKFHKLFSFGLVFAIILHIINLKLL